MGPRPRPPLREPNSSRRCAASTAGGCSKPCTATSRTAGDDDLEGDERLRFITNALTRLRVCDGSGRLLLKFKGPLEEMPPEAMPWFRAPRRRWAGARIVCGHWSALGYVDENGVLGLDTGCVWGGTLTAQRLDAPSAPVAVPSTLPAVF